MQARVRVTQCARRKGLRDWTVISLVVALALSGVLAAQEEPNASVTTAAADRPTAVRQPAGPFVAEITGNDVYIRSGPGTNFYHCGKLYAGDRVQVVREQQGWSAIVPPPGCFSWIAMQFVSINLQDPTVGIVTGNNVGVYAGSDYVEPWNSTSKQVTLSQGQTVKLLGEEKDDYYKIAPPKGAYLWVSSQYAERTDRGPNRPPEIDVSKMVKELDRPDIDPNATPRTDLERYYLLSEKIKAERGKPLDEQDYAEIKEKLEAIVAKKTGDRASRYAEYTLKQIERYELARKVAKELDLQNKELEKVTSKIDQAHDAKLAQVEDLSKFAIMGKLANSSVYNVVGQAKRYRILNESGKTVCYVTPTGAVATQDLSKYVGRKVGLVGKIEAHEATARAFIEFNEIVPLD